jgi:membrane dipeptidase
MTVRTIVALGVVSMLAACGPAQQGETSSEETHAAPDLATQAMAIAKNSIIVDTHIDVPARIHRAWEDVSQATDGGDYDYH